jgi:hypothetical protein
MNQLNQMNQSNNIMKSKSAMTFQEFKKKMNEHHDFENEWGHFIDIEEHYKHSLNMKEQEDEEYEEEKRRKKEIYQKKQIEKQLEIFNKKYKNYQDNKDESHNNIVTDLLKYTFTIIITVNLAYLVFHHVI